MSRNPRGLPSLTLAPSSTPAIARVGGVPEYQTVKVHTGYPRVLRHPCLLWCAPHLKTKRRRIGTILISSFKPQNWRLIFMKMDPWPQGERGKN